MSFKGIVVNSTYFIFVWGAGVLFPVIVNDVESRT